MPLVVLPDIERIVTTYLTSVPEITGIVGQRVVSRIPNSPTFPLLRYTTPGLGGVPLQGWLGEMGLDFHAYANTKSAARNLAAVAQAVLPEMVGSTPYGVVSRVEDRSNIFELQDPVYGDQVTRYMFQVAIRAHPL